ncbi:hypothetical protein BS50DRAFT_580181 [Corynespora cassiicola Philippines]|uniref:Uncharacterized protein n=1 Tax=Corynespora cassiicola Philippines TaxID=1448308 RepID=A0A2T2N2B3_CORCC|nr:hypothetical protein BS50DRAFT_580181 [Corynespora cassiicola Philippines]
MQTRWPPPSQIVADAATLQCFLCCKHENCRILPRDSACGRQGHGASASSRWSLLEVMSPRRMREKAGVHAWALCTRGVSQCTCPGRTSGLLAPLCLPSSLSSAMQAGSCRTEKHGGASFVSAGAQTQHGPQPFGARGSGLSCSARAISDERRAAKRILSARHGLHLPST